MAYNSPELPSGAYITLGLAAGVRIELGTLVARNAAGNAVPAADAAGLRVIGRAEQDVNNTLGLIDAVNVLVKRGTFRFENSATNPVTKAVIGLPCFIQNATTVARVGGTNSIVAGVVVSFDSSGVYVDTIYNAAI